MYSLTLFHVICFVLNVHANDDIRSHSRYDYFGVLWPNFVVKGRAFAVAEPSRVILTLLPGNGKPRDQISARGTNSEKLPPELSVASCFVYAGFVSVKRQQ